MLIADGKELLATEVNCAKSEDEQDRIEALHTGAAFSKKRTEVIHMSQRIASARRRP